MPGDPAVRASARSRPIGSVDTRAADAVTIAAMPIYEFECEECGAVFDALVDAGTETVECRSCGAGRTVRRYSPQASAFKLVKSPGTARQQEARNAKLHADTKAQFKARRKAQRDAKKKASGGGG